MHNWETEPSTTRHTGEMQIKEEKPKGNTERKQVAISKGGGFQKLKAE